MPCFHPNRVWRDQNGRNEETGKWPVTFRAKDGVPGTEMEVHCGQCIGCRVDRSLDWAIRCVHESKMHDKNCFITLTYDDDKLTFTPIGEPTLVKDHWIKFMKRLRAKYGEGIRFFHCGEYGELTQRPHYHACLFGHDFQDRELYSYRKGVRLDTSEELSDLWPYGYSTVGDVTYESAAYVARYIMKKITGKGAEAHYKGRQPDYILMSRRPGVGRPWLEKYIDDVYPHDYIVRYLKGKVKPSRYYDNIYDKINSDSMEKIKKLRKEKLEKHKSNNTLCRLEVREYVLNSKLMLLNRNL